MNIHISIDPGSYLGKLPNNISSDSLVLIIGNLLQNAMDSLKYSKDGQISFTLLEKEDEILLVVEDNGLGISESDITLIFQKKYSTKGMNRGYGLYLVKHQVEVVLNGNIYVTSNENEGTSFLVSIPQKTNKEKEIKKLIS